MKPKQSPVRVFRSRIHFLLLSKWLPDALLGLNGLYLGAFTRSDKFGGQSLYTKCPRYVAQIRIMETVIRSSLILKCFFFLGALTENDLDLLSYVPLFNIPRVRALDQCYSAKRHFVPKVLTTDLPS